MSSLLELLYSRSGVEVTLPSGATAQIIQMSGIEQKLMTDKNQMLSGAAINKVLANCTQVLNDQDLTTLSTEDKMAVMNRLLSADRQALLFHIRKVSLGSTFQFGAKCPECEHQGEWEVNLNDAGFQCKQFTFDVNEDGSPNKQFHEWVHPAGIRFRANYLTGADELLAVKNRTKLHGISDLEMRQVRFLNTDKDNMWQLISAAQLRGNLIEDIRAEMRRVEGEQDDTVTVSCTNCQQEVSFTLLDTPGFLIPSVR